MFVAPASNAGYKCPGYANGSIAKSGDFTRYLTQMPAATLGQKAVYLNFTTTEPAGAGSIVRIVAEREEGEEGGTGAPGGAANFDRLVRGPRLTLAQARMTGLTNTQLDAADDLDVVLEDLLEFGQGASLWVAPLGAAARAALTAAAYSAGFPRFQTPPLIGLDELAAVVWPTNSGIGVSPMSKLDGLHPEKPPIAKDAFRIRYGAYLQHWTQTGACYFVTFRLTDSMPTESVEEWRREKDAALVRADSDPTLSPDEVVRLKRLADEKFEERLDSSTGECWLRDIRVAKLVADTLQFFDDERYRLISWCIMPNHVHVVFQPIAPHTISTILHSWKSYTAKCANEALGRTGKFWQEEYYDHLIRDDKDLMRCMEYTYFNPERAGIADWEWRGSSSKAIAEVMSGSVKAKSTEKERNVTGDLEVNVRHWRDVNATKQRWHRLIDGLLRLPLPLINEMNWLLSKTDHPLKGLLKSAESHAVKHDFGAAMDSGKLSLDKLFKDFTEIINRLGPDDEAGTAPPGAPDQPPEKPVTAAEIDGALGPDGPLAKTLEGFEERPEQLAMARRIAEALNSGHHLVAEAGTGIGKSLAYLVPAILFAKRAGRPVMISTHTKNLQSQLYEKDLPFLQKALGIEFEAALLKGRPNYLCLRKFMFTLQESAAELEEDERIRMLPVMTWATQTETGDVAELAAFSREQSPDLWDRLHTVGDDCLKRQCPFYKRCFVYKARGLTRTADVVVLNHSLVFSDLNIESGVLPPYNEIVFDEAHKLEDVATEHLACEVTPRRIYRILNKLFRVAQGSAASKGLLAALLANVELSRKDFSESIYDTIKNHILQAMQAIQPANEGSDAFFETVRGWTERAQSDFAEPPPQAYVPMERGRGPAPEAFDESTGEVLPPAPPPPQFARKNRKFGSQQADRRRYSAQTLQPRDAEQFTQGKEAAISRLGRLRQALNALQEDFKEIRKKQVARSRELLKEIEAQNLFLEELIHDIEFVVKGDEPNYVYWSEPLGRKGARVVAAPLDVAPLLYQQLYERKRSIILTSATLSLRDSEADEGAGFSPIVKSTQRNNEEIGAGKPHPKSFEFVKNRIGLKFCTPEKLDELLLGSPFDYDANCRFYIPTFLPEPGGAREKDFTARFASMIADLAIASGGRAMVLYTSYAALDASAKLLRKALAAEDIEVIAQGNDGSRESLLARLKEGKRTVLLGTASFWEGVDVRGDALSVLIIAKLPFAVFTDPIIEGRCELLEASGKDPFLHYSIPQAILKLRQGFGRLIRSKTDRGVVILADKRVVTRRYGAAFLRALPAKAHVMSSAETLTRTVKEFLESEKHIS